MKKECEYCGTEFEVNKRAPHRKYCLGKCRSAAHLKRGGRKRVYRRRRLHIINLLGGKCLLCDTEDVYVLTLDHIQNNGFMDRKRWSDDRARNRWIEKYPSEAKTLFQILCYNCNSLKAHYPEEYQRRYQEKKTKL